jgi:hypothetical protein
MKKLTIGNYYFILFVCYNGHAFLICTKQVESAKPALSSAANGVGSFYAKNQVYQLATVAKNT